MTDINTSVTEEFGDLPFDRVKALVEQKRRAGSQDGGIVIALRALRKRLERDAVSKAEPPQDTHRNRMAEIEAIKAQAQAIAPLDAEELDIQWLMVYLEEGANNDEALQMLAERRQPARE